jgi:hypothetical protein
MLASLPLIGGALLLPLAGCRVRRPYYCNYRIKATLCRVKVLQKAHSAEILGLAKHAGRLKRPETLGATSRAGQAR